MPKRKGRKGVNPKGRNTSTVERVLIVRRSLFHSPQFSALSSSARALFLELHAMFNGTNNGQIFLSVRDAAARIGFADLKAAIAAFRELEEMGFIRETIAGHFALKAGEISRARAWHLNWIGSDGRCVGPNDIQPLNFTNMTSKQKRRVAERQQVLSRYLKDYQRGQFAVEDSSTLSVRKAAARPVGVMESTTLVTKNPGIPANVVAQESSTHLNYHGGLGTCCPKHGLGGSSAAVDKG